MLKTEARWNEWEPAFEIFLSCAFGVDGVLLSYVIRALDASDRTTMFHDFADKCVACAPLHGPAFDADKRIVHQLMVFLPKVRCQKIGLSQSSLLRMGGKI